MKKVFLAVAVIAGFTFMSCNDDDGPSGTTARVELRLTDGPADYEEVNVDIQEVIFKVSGGEDVVFPLDSAGVYNLLELSNGVDVLLGDNELPVGEVSQIRLVLGENNTIKIDGTVYPLDTPSAQQSGLKLNVHYNLEPGMLYTIWLDFDAGKSIVERGDGTYGLKPVIKAFTELTNGRIEGTVLPSEAETTVYAMQNTVDTIGVAIPNPDGYFKFSGLDEGSYDLTFDAGNAAYQDQQLNGVQIVTGTVTNVGEITMVPVP